MWQRVFISVSFFFFSSLQQVEQQVSVSGTNGTCHLSPFYEIEKQNPFVLCRSFISMYSTPDTLCRHAPTAQLMEKNIWWSLSSMEVMMEAPLSDLLFSLICIIITHHHYLFHQLWSCIWLWVRVANVKCSHIAKKLVSILKIDPHTSWFLP